MRKILFWALGCLFVLPAFADNVATTKPYVDYNIAQKQNIIPGIPSGYTPVEYIENTGGSYINTGVSGYGTWDIDVQGVTAPVGKNAVLVAYYNYAPAWFGASTNNKWGFGANGYYFADNFTDRVNVNLEFASKRATATINGVTINRTSTNTHTLNNYQLMDYNSSYPMVAKLYSAKFYNASGQLVFNGIPVKYNNVCGLYDTVSKTFKPSNSGTAFTCGPVGVREMVTYGASAGDIGARMIVDSLGSDTTAETVPTTGAVNSVKENKMAKVDAKAGWVMAGEVYTTLLGVTPQNSKKPIYDPSTRNYDDALVTATRLNTTATAAANSELSCVDNDCTLWSLNTTGVTTMTTVCKPINTACINNSECCTGNCGAELGKCGAAQALCAGLGESCSKLKCCTGFVCNDISQTCGRASLACAGVGEACSDIMPCCFGTCSRETCVTLKE